MNLIPTRIDRTREHTTFTKADRPCEDRGTFSIASAIEEQVAKEDLVSWSFRKEEPKLVGPLPDPARMGRAPMHAFIKSVIGLLP